MGQPENPLISKLRTRCGHEEKKKNAKSLFLNDLAFLKSTTGYYFHEPIFRRLRPDMGVKTLDTKPRRSPCYLQ